MTSKHLSNPTAVPTGADDLTRIRGIGAAIARRLSAAGVATFEQLAEQSPASLAALVGVAGYSASQIARQDWIGQARELATEPPIR